MGDSCASTFQWAFLSVAAIVWVRLLQVLSVRLYNSNIKNYFDRKIIFGTTTQAFGAKAPVSNPRDNAIYSHWYMKSNHHPADVPSCGRLCSKEQNQDCEVRDLKVNEGAEFKCTGHQMKRTKAGAVLNFTFLNA